LASPTTVADQIVFFAHGVYVAKTLPGRRSVRQCAQAAAKRFTKMLAFL